MAGHEIDDFEDAPARSGYFERKDLRILALCGVLALVILTPVYLKLKADSQKHLCKTNIAAIGKALQEYAAENGDMYPPLFFGDREGKVLVDSNGKPFTWVTLSSQYLSARASFSCPSAASENSSVSQHFDSNSKELRADYGMYQAWNCFPVSNIKSPSSSVLVSETENNGAAGTYDPEPLVTTTGGAIRDGFVIGIDREMSFATRLAYPNSKGHKFNRDGDGRHAAGNWFLFVDGHAAFFPPTAARLQKIDKQITGYWAKE